MITPKQKSAHPLVQQSECGFFELIQKPSAEELAEFYNRKYFDSKNFEIQYSEEEKFHKYLNFIEAEYIFNAHSNDKSQKQFSFLDFGCGEGFGLDYFSSKNWKVTGIDYSKDGVQRHFPEQLPSLLVGDCEKILEKLIDKGPQFDLIVLNNVLEHLLNPISTLQKLSQIIQPQGLIRVQVPNDFSDLQLSALAKGKIDSEFWVAPHEHMSYFNSETLPEVFIKADLAPVEVLGDFPIDFNLFNDNSNYIKQPSNGKSCHLQRLAIENLLAQKSAGSLVAFRRGCGQAGLGRNVIVYGRKQKA